MIEDAGRIKTAADDLNALLARIVEDGPIAEPEPDAIRLAIAAIDRLLRRQS